MQQSPAARFRGETQTWLANQCGFSWRLFLRGFPYGPCNPNDAVNDQSGPTPGVTNKSRAQLSHQLFQIPISLYAATHVNGDTGAEVTLNAALR